MSKSNTQLQSMIQRYDVQRHAPDKPHDDEVHIPIVVHTYPRPSALLDRILDVRAPRLAERTEA